MTNSESRIRARLQAKRDISEGLAILRFELAEEFLFKPGQYATLWLTHRGQTVPRPYSIASSPSGKRVLEFYINLVDSGRLTRSLWDENVVRGLQEQDPETFVEVTGPKGRFLLDPVDPRDLVFVASGTGLAPFMSMIRKMNEDCLASAEDFQGRSVYVIHGVSYSSNLGYHEELKGLARESLMDPARKLAVAYFPTISRPRVDPGWVGLTGRAETLFEPPQNPDFSSPSPNLPVQQMLRAMLRPETHAVYICGYPGTVDAVERSLSRRGFRPDRDLKREKYYP